MLRLTHLSLALVFAGLVGAGGCTVGAPTTGFGQDTGTKKTTGDDMGGTGTPTPTGDMAAPLLPPSPSTFSQTSAWTTVPIHGTTSPPNSSVIITAMDGTQTSADVDGSGSFCANLVLQPNKTNTFQLKTHDNNSGNESDSVSIQVTQAGQPNQGTSTQDAENAALGGAGTAYNIGARGTAAAQAVTDGDTTTWYEGSYYNTWTASYPAPAVVVQLNQTSSINKIVAVLASDCIGDGTLTLAYSAQSAPAAPGPGASGWITTNATKSSDGSTWSATFDPATASSIAMWWNNVSFSNTFDQGGCGSQGFTYGLAELQGWTAQGVVQPPQTAPTCGL